MRVIENKNERAKLTFADLPIGYAYRDKEGALCIKTDHDDLEVHYNHIMYNNGGWEPHIEAMDTIVLPVEATLTVEG